MEVLNSINNVQRHINRFGVRFTRLNIDSRLKNNGVLQLNGTSEKIVCQHSRFHTDRLHIYRLYTARLSEHKPHNFVPIRVVSGGNICRQTLSSHKYAAARNESGKNEPFPTDKGMNLRVNIENDYLSWMRNSYIMTLGGVSMLHFDLWSAGPVAGAAALMTSGMNLLFGTIGYIHNLRNLRHREYISGFMCRMGQLWAIVHFIFWGMVLMVIFPEYRLIEAVDLDDKDGDSDNKS